MLQFGAERAEVRADLDDFTDPKATNKVAAVVARRFSRRTPEKPNRREIGLPGWNAYGHMELLSQQELLQQRECDTAFNPLPTCRNRVRTDSKQKIVERLSTNLQNCSSCGCRNCSQKNTRARG
jgi:hypothetical protein